MNDFPAEYSAAEYSDAERRWLLGLAHQSIRAAVRRQTLPAEAASTQLRDANSGDAALGAPLRDAPLRDAPLQDSHLQEKRGAFVSLYEDGKLRGCIGRIAAVTPLEETVREMARAAALEDPRFVPVEVEELERLQVEISVLSPMREISPDEVVVGRDGLMISYAGRRGLLLPQVPLQWKWTREMFLAQTCLKAGLPPNQWMHGAKIEAFTAEVFGEQQPGDSLRE